jgi:tetratricopeptide (TPR) repeat protein
MKRHARQLVLVVILALSGALLTQVRAETESIDLKALAKKARPAVMLLVVSDANGKEIATGTGFLVSSDGKLITNHHVIEHVARAVAKAENGGLFPVEGVLADDPKNDLVLLKLKGKDLPFLTLGNSDKIEVGTRIAVIGSPLGLEGTLSEGIVSALRELSGKDKWLQITAAISSGSSGSPVLNAKGEVIGVATALLREGQSLNFAIPVDAAQYLLAKGGGTTSPKPFDIISDRGTPDSLDLLADADFLASHESMEKGEYAEALKHIKAVLTRFPNSADAYVQLGRIYSSLKFVDEAVAAYAEAAKILKQRIKNQPDDDGAWASLGYLYEAQGKDTDAITAYKQAANVANFPGQWATLGAAYMNQRDYGNAIQAYQQGIKLIAERIPDSNTNHPWSLFRVILWDDLGDAYSGAARLSDAIDAYKQSIKVRPDNAYTWNKLGLAYRAAGQEAQAADAFDRARKLKSNLVK